MRPGRVDHGDCPNGCDATLDLVLRQRDAARVMVRNLQGVACMLALLAIWGWLG